MRLIAATFLVFTLLISREVNAQGTFTEPVVISDFSGETANPPAVGMANSGEAIIAYRRPTEGSVRAYYRAAYGAPFTNKFLGDNGCTPSVVVNDAGDMLVGWIGCGSNGASIAYKKRGSSTFTYKLLDNNNGLLSEFSIAMNSNGDILVAWRASATSPTRRQFRTFYKAANADWPAPLSVSGNPLPHEVALDNAPVSKPYIALDDNNNAALYWIDSYATLDNPDPKGDGSFSAVKQMLKQGTSGTWGAPSFVTPVKNEGDAVPCSSSVSGFPHVEFMQISSDPKTGLVGLGLFYSDNWNPYQSTGEQSGECQNASDGSAAYNPGFATIFGSVISGISGVPAFAFRGPEMQEAYLSVSNASSAVALYSDDYDAVTQFPATFRIGLGNPGSAVVSDSHVLERIVDVRVSMAADGTALATAFAAVGPAFGDPNAQEAAYGFVKKAGLLFVAHELLPEASMAGVGANCRGDGLFAILTNGTVAGNFERKLYFVEYDSGNPTCVEGVVDPTPVPTLTPSPTPTVDPSVPTKVPTPEPTPDIFAAAKINSSKMYDVLTEFFNATRGFRHPLIDTKKHKAKLKKVKAAWKKLNTVFPGAVPELFFIPGKNQAQFNEHWVALRKSYKFVMRDKDDERPYRNALRIVVHLPDDMRRALAF